jgi:hypothetical protein
VGIPRSLRPPLRVPRARPWNEASFAAEGSGGSWSSLVKRTDCSVWVVVEVDMAKQRDVVPETWAVIRCILRKSITTGKELPFKDPSELSPNSYLWRDWGTPPCHWKALDVK